MPDYRIRPLPVPGCSYFADGVHVDENGHNWLGEVNVDESGVVPYTDRQGAPIPAPDNWRECIVEQLRPTQPSGEQAKAQAHPYPHQIGLKALRFLQGAMFYASFVDIAVGQYVRRYGEEAYLSIRDEMLRAGTSAETFESGGDCFREYLDTLPNPVFQTSLFAMRTSWDWYLRRLVRFIAFARDYLGEPPLTRKERDQWEKIGRLRIEKQLLLLEQVTACKFAIDTAVIRDVEEMTLVLTLGGHHHWEVDDEYLHGTMHPERWRLGQVRAFAGDELLTWRTALGVILRCATDVIARRYRSVPQYSP